MRNHIAHSIISDIITILFIVAASAFITWCAWGGVAGLDG